MEQAKVSILLSVGTELTEGSILNTHFRFLGSALKGLGFRVVRAVQIPDDRQVFLRELAGGAEECGLMVVTGGLGPTSDDLTRQVVADAAGVELRFNAGIWERLVARFSVSGRRIADTNRKQAWIPAGFEVLDNPVGTAPGFWGRVGRCVIVALPGPPRELEPMFEREVLPVIRTLFPQAETRGRRESSGGPGGADAGELVAVLLMVSESVLEEQLQELRDGAKGLRWGTRVADDRIVLTLRGLGDRGRQSILGELRRRFGAARVRRGDRRPSELLCEVLREKEERIAVAESCTGGYLAKLITDIPGSSAVFWGGVVCYSNEAKQRLLGVDPEVLRSAGAVSAQTVAAMSAGALERSPADVALAVTGIAGPGGGSPEKSVGTVWISARRRKGPELHRRFRLFGDREGVRRRSAVAALLLGESLLRGRDVDWTE